MTLAHLIRKHEVTEQPWWRRELLPLLTNYDGSHTMICGVRSGRFVIAGGRSTAQMMRELLLTKEHDERTRTP